MVSESPLSYRLAFTHIGSQSTQETRCSNGYNQHRIEGCLSSNHCDSEQDHFFHTTYEANVRESQWSVSSLLQRSGAKEEPRSFPAIWSHWSLNKKKKCWKVLSVSSVCTGVDLRATSLHQIGSGCRIAAQMGQHYVGDSSEMSHFTYASYWAHLGVD